MRRPMSATGGHDSSGDVLSKGIPAAVVCRTLSGRATYSSNTEPPMNSRRSDCGGISLS